MSVPSCPLAFTNPIQLHTLRCSGGPYAPVEQSPRKNVPWTSRYSDWYMFHLHRWTDSRPIWRQLQLGNLGKSCAKVEATSDRQIVFLLERQRQAPFYIHGNQYACVLASNQAQPLLIWWRRDLRLGASKNKRALIGSFKGKSPSKGKIPYQGDGAPQRNGGETCRKKKTPRQFDGHLESRFRFAHLDHGTTLAKRQRAQARDLSSMHAPVVWRAWPRYA